MPRLVCGVGKDTADAWVEALAAALGSREPRFIEMRWLEAGTIHWMVTELPSVYVAPDVYAALKSRGIVETHPAVARILARMQSGGPCRG